MSKKNTDIFKCLAKRKKKYEIVIYPGNQTKCSVVWKRQITQFIIQLFLLWNFYYCVSPVEKVLFSVLKLIWKVNIPKERSFNLIPEHQRMLFRNSTPKLFNVDILRCRLGYVMKIMLCWRKNLTVGEACQRKYIWF